MKERPILFSGAMVHAILAGTKTQTRRLVRCDVGDVIHHVDGEPWRSNLCITEEDARAEGVTICTHEPMHASTYARAFACLWDSINGTRGPWSSNPWVWVVSFRRVPS